MGVFYSKAEDPFDPATDLVELKDKVVIVTGGNRGIGYTTARFFARAGAKVYLTARNAQAAQDATQLLNSEGLGPGNGEILFLKLDQSDPRKAKAATEELLKRESKLDNLVLNAALIRGAYELNSDGWSVAITTMSAHPGIVKTYLNDPQTHLLWKLLGHLLGVDADYGAYNTMFAGASKQVVQKKEEYKGKYIEPVGKVVALSAPVVGNGSSEALSRTTEDFLKKIGVL